jgi:ATP-dependent Clp protease ATP-binding subunit ClpA
MMMMTRKPCQFVPMQPCWPNHRYDDPMANSYDQQQALHANPSPESYMLSNSSESGAGTTVHPKFTELTAENLKVLCKTLENRVPHHEDIVADIASVVLQCRSGMMTRGTRRHREKPDLATWLLFHGRDTDGKKAVAQELARLVFGSYTNFISISLSNYTPVHSKSSSGEVIRKGHWAMGRMAMFKGCTIQY